jgi:hypothetical protein
MMLIDVNFRSTTTKRSCQKESGAPAAGSRHPNREIRIRAFSALFDNVHKDQLNSMRLHLVSGNASTAPEEQTSEEESE